MAAGRTLARVVAPPARRKPFAARELWVPAAILVALGGLAVALEATEQVMFVRPWRLALLLPLVPWLWWLSRVGGGGGLARVRKALALGVRVALVALAIGLTAEPRAVRASDDRAVVFVLDASDSIPPAHQDPALRWILEANRLRDASTVDMGLVVFGREAAVELPPRKSFAFEGAINTQIARDATNIEQALALAFALIPADTSGRVVLLSDGVATDGTAARATAELARRKVPVDVLAIDYAYGAEVWVERIDLPRQIKVGEPYEANIVVGALGPGSGELVLRENGREIGRIPVDYQEGKTRVRAKLELRTPGYYEYSAALRVGDGADHRRENNVAIGHVYLKGEGKVLVVHDAEGDPLDRTHLVQALRASKRVVEEMAAPDVPRDALSLLSYDLIVLVNVPAEQLDLLQMDAVRDAVFDHGVGAIMVGGKDSFGPGGYHKTPIEELLPVDMDVSQKKVLPKSALAIVLHTCEFPEGNSRAKSITKQAIRVLSPRDEVGVLIYGAGGVAGGFGDTWLFPLTPVAEYARLATLINGAEIGDMPAFGPTMTLALAGLAASDAAAKHMILISDGDPQPPTPALLASYKQQKISVSTVSIFPHGGQEVALLRQIAEATGGRYYSPDDPNKLPSIFIREAKTLKRSMIQAGRFVPRLGDPSPVLKGIDALPPLHAFVLTTPKPRATVALAAPSDDQLDPVLAIWRYGLGQSAAFTSDLTANWAKDWIGWDGYAAFVRQLAEEVSRAERASHLSLVAGASGSKAVIEVEDHHPADTVLELRARIAGPRDQDRTVPLEPVGPRRYRAELPLWGVGRYQVSVAGAAAGRTDQAFAGFAVPYSAEYLRFRADPAALAEIARATGGRELGPDDHARVFDPPTERPRRSRPLDNELLVLLAWLLVVDVALRRIQIDWTRLLLWWRRKGTQTQTMSTLLATKQRLADLRPRSGELLAAPPPPLVPPRVRLAPATKPAPAAKPAAEAAKPPAGAPAAPPSTTGHLLALKRKRDKGKNPLDPP